MRAGTKVMGKHEDRSPFINHKALVALAVSHGSGMNVTGLSMREQRQGTIEALSPMAHTQLPRTKMADALTHKAHIVADGDRGESRFV
jgi:hypothetical protein